MTLMQLATFGSQTSLLISRSSAENMDKNPDNTNGANKALVATARSCLSFKRSLALAVATA